MNKKYAVFLIIIFSVVCIFYVYLCFKPIVIHKQSDQNIFLSNDLYNPMDTIDFETGENKIVIYTNWKDIFFLPKNIKSWTLLVCTNNSIIEEIVNNFEFRKISENIVETTDYDSRIFFIKNGKLTFVGKLIIGESVSLYFNNTGWTFAENYNELIVLFSKFKPKYVPVILLE